MSTRACTEKRRCESEAEVARGTGGEKNAPHGRIAGVVASIRSALGLLTSYKHEAKHNIWKGKSNTHIIQYDKYRIHI